MKKQKFSSSNIVFGVGASTYQNSTRDTLGFAMKATYIEIDGKGKEIFKDPKTDKYKKSAKGLLAINKGKLKENAT
jgi:nicotinamide phosphoribosyltransferase